MLSCSSHGCFCQVDVGLGPSSFRTHLGVLPEESLPGGCELPCATARWLARRWSLLANPQRSAAVRTQARRFQLDDLRQKELADALTIMLERLDEWEWPAEGMPVYTAETPNKWRLFLDEEL